MSSTLPPIHLVNRPSERRVFKKDTWLRVGDMVISKEPVPWSPGSKELKHFNEVYVEQFNLCIMSFRNSAQNTVDKTVYKSALTWDACKTSRCILQISYHDTVGLLIIDKRTQSVISYYLPLQALKRDKVYAPLWKLVLRQFVKWSGTASPCITTGLPAPSQASKFAGKISHNLVLMYLSSMCASNSAVLDLRETAHDLHHLWMLSHMVALQLRGGNISAPGTEDAHEFMLDEWNMLDSFRLAAGDRSFTQTVARQLPPPQCPDTES